MNECVNKKVTNSFKRRAWISACNVMLANSFNVFASTRVWCCWVNVKKSHASCECSCNALILALFFCLYPPLLVSHITDLSLDNVGIKSLCKSSRVAQQPQANEWKIKFITPRIHHNVSFVFEGLGTLGLHNLNPTSSISANKSLFQQNQTS